MERQTAGPGRPIRITALRWLVALLALLGAAWIAGPDADRGSPDATVAVEIAAPAVATRRRRFTIPRPLRRRRPAVSRGSRPSPVARTSTALAGGPAPPRAPPTR